MLDARRGDAEHGEPERRLGVGRVWQRPYEHAGERLGAVAQDLARDPVEAGDVGHRYVIPGISDGPT